MVRKRTTIGVASLALLASAALSASATHAQDQTPVPPGFTSLFNGKNLDGWKGGLTVDPAKITPQQQREWDADVPKHWRVDNGEIVNDGNDPFLATVKDYGDYVLWVDWKLSPQGDSGIYLRGCPQVQLWDPKNEAAFKHGADKGSGALWNNDKDGKFPPVVADKPTGQWNRMYIRIVGPYVKVMLNDKLTVDNKILENYYDRARPVPPRGPIDLQSHGSETRFRNVFIREIPPEEADKLLSEIRGGEEGFGAVFNGTNLDGWVGATDNYEVVDGAIQAKAGRGGNLLTERQFDNFVARLQFKLPPGGNNGLAIRSPAPDVDNAYEGLEIQVLDDRDAKYADLHDYQAHGSVYGLAPALRGYLRPLDQWNYEEVVVDGDKVEVRLNGYKILDADLAQARKKPLDGKQHPGASRTTGHFGFCGHQDPVAFRNVRIKPL
jgi:hypothetical protein